jgi:hypothetical protein
MSKSRWMVFALFSLVAATPTISKAQVADSTKEHAQDFVHDVLKAILGPNWNVFAQGGVATGERYLLQQAVNPVDGQRALQSATGYTIGAGAGVDILLRTGFRASYSFSSSGLNFRTDNGNGSNALNIDDVGTLRSHTVALEVMRYMLPARATITPYATLGIHGTWWVLDEKSPLVTSNDATPFSISPLFAFGMQVKASQHWSGRLEANLFGGHNPFTGNKSFRSLAGLAIDEPTTVNHTDFRLAGVYHFGTSTKTSPPSPVAHK